jgi:hypothetical protein
MVAVLGPYEALPYYIHISVYYQMINCCSLVTVAEQSNA